jgi:hypothetical protein
MVRACALCEGLGTSYQAGRATQRAPQSSRATNKATNNITITATIRALPSWKAPPDAEVLLRLVSLRSNLPRMVLPFAFVALLLNLLYGTTRRPELTINFRFGFTKLTATSSTPLSPPPSLPPSPLLFPPFLLQRLLLRRPLLWGSPPHPPCCRSPFLRLPLL